MLSEQNPLLAGVFGEQSRLVFARMLQIREQEAKSDKKVCVCVSESVCTRMYVCACV